MHNNNFVVAIKHAGRVLREHADLVTLPFGSEYSILVKNLNSTRAQFTVSVDGQDATESCRLILPPNDSVELERFIKGGNLSQGNKFKFIERSAAVEQHRGIGAEDGLVRVECWKEKVTPPPVYTPVHHYYDVWHPQQLPYYSTRFGGIQGSGNISYNANCHTSTVKSNSGFRSFDSSGDELIRSASCNFMQASGQSVGQASTSNSQTMDWGSAQNCVPTVNDAGITVGGSLSNQSFSSQLGFPLESQSTVITLKLRGEVAGKPVVQPVVVDVKVHCRTCGLVSKSSAQFCSRCGAGLIQY